MQLKACEMIDAMILFYETWGWLLEPRGQKLIRITLDCKKTSKRHGENKRTTGTQPLIEIGMLLTGSLNFGLHIAWEQNTPLKSMISTRLNPH